MKIKKYSWYKYFASYVLTIFAIRYAYSDDGSEEFDREDVLSLIKPGPFTSKESWSFSVSPDAKMPLGVNTAASQDGDTEEDKRE